MTGIESTFVMTGLLAGTALIAAMLWSIRYPERRVWPPQKFNMRATAIA